MTIPSELENHQASALAAGEIIPALASAIATVTIVGVGLSLTMTLLALRLGEQGYSARAIGLNPTAGGFAILAGAAFVPALARRISVKHLLFLALLISGLGLLSFALTNDYWAWLVIRAVFSGALSVLFVTSEYWINAIAPPRQRGFVLGFYMTSLAGGFAVGPGFWALSAPRARRLSSWPRLSSPSRPCRSSFGAARLPEIKSAPPVPVLGFLTAFPSRPLPDCCMARSKRRVSAFCPSMPFALVSVRKPEPCSSLCSRSAMSSFNSRLALPRTRWIDANYCYRLQFLSLCGAIALAFAGPSQFPLFCVLLVIWGGIVGSLYAVGLAHLGSQL